MADFGDLRPIPGTRPVLVHANARNPFSGFAADPEPVAPPSIASDGYAVFAGAQSIIPGRAAPPAPADAAKPVLLPSDPPLPAFLKNYAKDRTGAKLRPFSPRMTVWLLAVLGGIGRVLDQIDMARLAAGVRAHAAHVDRRQARHLEAWEALAAARAAIPPLQPKA